MTKVKINPGVCGMECTVEVSKIDRMNFNVKVESKCQMVTKLGEQFKTINMRDALKKYGQSVVFEQASQILAHGTCPVPTGLLKAIEAEARMALPRDVSITFIKE